MTADDRPVDQCHADFVTTSQPVTEGLRLGLTAAVVAVRDDEPMVLVAGPSETDRLPSGGFQPDAERSFESALRSIVERATGLELGHIEQLVTLSDRPPTPFVTGRQAHNVSIAYLGLARLAESDAGGNGRAVRSWQSWYTYVPWEDWRGGRPRLLVETIAPLLEQWASEPELGAPPAGLGRQARVRIAFATDKGRWDEERALERYELLYESGLLEEARRNGRRPPLGAPIPPLGRAMHADHRRVLSTAISRIRGKIKSRPIVFEMMPEEFTLFELQRNVEALLGPHLHKQNFRRLIETGRLVEPTGAVRNRTGGRPAKLFRFRPEVVVERTAPGVRVRPPR